MSSRCAAVYTDRSWSTGIETVVVANRTVDLGSTGLVWIGLGKGGENDINLK